MAVEVCSSDDDRRATLAGGETPMTIRLSFLVHSLEEEERIVTLLSWAGVNSIDTELVKLGDAAATNGNAPPSRA
jgi:hypothetical protein